MADLIDRQAAIDAVNRYDFKYPKYAERFVTELRDAMKADITDDLEYLPSAQPERKIGRWKGEGFGDYRCSWCGEVSHPQTNFCPNCGADMRTPTQVQLDEADDVMMGGNNETD